MIPRSPSPRVGLLGSVVVLLGAGLGGCFNSHVFDVIPPCEVVQQNVNLKIDATKAADILVVVDNSGSMCEEQQNLAANFFNDAVDPVTGEPECPIVDLNNVPEPYRNPTDLIVADELSQCGFIQILAAYENDFRVGVITTDVGLCDNRGNVAGNPDDPISCGAVDAAWGHRPQRGCLQAPAGWERKYLTPDDDDIGNRFTDILDNVATFGSPFERGLDAAKIFLDPAADRHPACEDDAEGFLRADASLILLFLTDEDDCSHVDHPTYFPDEYVNDKCDDTDTTLPSQQFNPGDCYKPEKQAYLVPTADYAEFYRNAKGPLGDVRVAVIAGATFAGDDPVPGGCTIDDALPQGGCTLTRGSSIYNDDDTHETCQIPQQGIDTPEPCCVADPGTRYFEVADQLNGFKDSICYTSFRQTMIDIASFVSRVEFVTLDEAPPIPAALIVSVRRAGQTEPEELERIPDGEDPEGRDGWQLRGCCTVQFYGESAPQPGDDIVVSVLADSGSADSEQCVGFPSDGPPSPDAGPGPAADAGG